MLDPCRRLPAHQMDLRTQFPEMQIELERHAGTEPSTDQRKAPSAIAEKLERALEFRARQLAERALDIGDDGPAVSIDEIRIGTPSPMVRRHLGQRRLQSLLELVAQSLLETGIAGKPQLGHQAKDGGAADPGALGELRHGFQA